MSERGRSTSPRPIQDADVDMANAALSPKDKPDAKVVIVNNLTRNVVEAHLRVIFGFYGQITKIDLPLFGKSGQNRGKAALEFSEPSEAHKAASHMNGGQLDGAVLKVELSELPVHSRSRSPRPPPRNGRDRPRSFSRSLTRSRSPPGRFRRRPDDGYRGRGFGRRGGRGGRDFPRRGGRSRSRSRSRSPVHRGLGPRRRSPSYSRGGYGRMRRSRSRSYSVRSSRSRSRSYSRSRSRSRSLSYSSYSRYSRSRSRSRTGSKSRSLSRGKRSLSRDDIRDSRSRSPARD